MCFMVMLCGWQRRKARQQDLLPTLQLRIETCKLAAVAFWLQTPHRPSHFDSPCLGAFSCMQAPADDL